MRLTKRNLLFFVIFTAANTPVMFFMLGFGAIMQMNGFSADNIGVFQTALLAIILSLLVAPFIDKFGLKTNHYKNWTIALGVLCSLSIFLLAFVSLNDKKILFLVSFCILLISGLLDTTANALAIKIYDRKESKTVGAYKMTAVFCSMLLGSGVSLLIYSRLGWSFCVYFLAALVLLSLSALFFIDENTETVSPERLNLKEILSFFKQENIGIWLFILCFYVGIIAAAWAFLKPFLIFKGINADKVAFYVGIYGSVIGALASFAAIKINNIFSKRTILTVFGSLNFAAILMLYFMVGADINDFLLIASVSLCVISMSFSTSVIFALMMEFSRKNLRGSDYALQSALRLIFRTVSVVICGILITNFGYGISFLALSILMILAVWAVWVRPI